MMFGVEVTAFIDRAMGEMLLVRKLTLVGRTEGTTFVVDSSIDILVLDLEETSMFEVMAVLVICAECGVAIEGVT